MGIHFERGQALFDLERYHEAIHEYQLDLAENPESALTQVNLAAALFNCGKVAEAEELVAKAISIDPELAHSHCVQSHIFQVRHQFRSARQAILEAIRLEPSADYFYRLAQIYDWKQDREQVLNATASAIQQDPWHVPSIILRGRKLTELGRLEEANALFATALRANPNAAEAHHAMGKLQLTTGDADSALHLLKEARRLDPLHVNDKLAIAEAYGLNLPILRVLNRYVVRWHLWRFTWKWIVAVTLTMIFCVATEFASSPAIRRTDISDVNKLWLIFCILVLNYLVLPYSVAKVARAIAFVVGRRQMELSWWNFFSQPVIFFWLFVVHGSATLLGASFAIMPELLAMIAACSTCYPLVVALARAKVNRLAGYVCFPLIIVGSIFGVLGVSLIAFTDGNDPEHAAGWIALLSFFFFTFFSDKIASWTGTTQLIKTS